MKEIGSYLSHLQHYRLGRRVLSQQRVHGT